MNLDQKNKYPNQPENEIWFYDSGNNYYEFTNFYHNKSNNHSLPPDFPIKVALPKINSVGAIEENNDPSQIKEWKTSEHLFQAIKFVGGGVKSARTDLSEKIRKEKYAGGVFKLANGRTGTYSTEYDHNWWDKVSSKVMAWVLEKKFQHEELKKLLMDTGSKKIIEFSDKDTNWGSGRINGKPGSGKNRLGEALEELRTKLQKKANWTPPATSNSTADNSSSSTQTPTADNTSQNSENNTSPKPNSTKPNDQNQEQNNKPPTDDEGDNNPPPNTPPKTTDNPKPQPNSSNLPALCDQAITTITVALNQEPKIPESELSNPNWKELIQKATNEKEINNLQEEMLEEIKQKRIAKTNNDKLENLIQQAQTKNDNYEELEAILKQIRELSYLALYQEKRDIIRTLENKLGELSPEKHQTTVKKEIMEKMSQTKLRPEDLGEETRKKWKKINNGETIDPQKINADKEEIMEKIGEKWAENELKKLLAIAWQAKTAKEKEGAKQQIIRFIKEQNRFNQQAYQNNIKEVENSLTRLRSEETETQGKKPNDNSKNLLIIGGFLIVISALLAVSIKVRKIKRLKRQK